ncbi:hypothetical protein [Sulfitobacter sp.]|uniref:hypothetical protein n=1 Tax=Sulfitobacter sp. TaxID=1903071 RepID=UPI0035698A1A
MSQTDELSQGFVSPQRLSKTSGWPIGRVRRLIKDRKIRFVMIGRNYYLPSTALSEYFDQNMVDPMKCSGIEV